MPQAPVTAEPMVISAAPVPVAAPVDPAAEATLSASLADRTNSQRVSFGNLRTMQPLSAQKATGTPVPVTDDSQVPPATDQPAAMTAQRDPAILSLATNNDLNLATLAREANKNRGNAGQSPNEVIIPLH
jgi:hypothetical protein